MRKVKKGATLLEVVIALAILGIMIMPLMNSLLTAVRANKKGEEVQDAKLIGQQVVEKLRLEEEIKTGSITLDNFEITLGSEVTGSGKDYYPLNSTDVEGYELTGKIYEDAVLRINADSDVSSYLDDELGALIIVMSDEIYYAELKYQDKTIKKIFEDEKNDTSDGFKKRIVTGMTDVNLEFKDNGLATEDKVYNIEMDGINIAMDTNYGIGIYVAEKNNFNFKIKNSSDKTQSIHIFRDSNLTKKEGTLDGQVQTNGIFDKYTNIIFDSKDKHRGLYTAELEVKRSGKVLEKIESQFYLNE